MKATITPNFGPTTGGLPSKDVPTPTRSIVSRLGLVAALLLPLGSVAQVIIQDDFTTPSADLQGRAPAVAQAPGNVWSRVTTGAGGAVVSNGVLVLNGPSRTTGYAVAFLPFNPAGIVDPYELSLDLRYERVAGSGEFYFGLGTNPSTYVDYALSLGFRGQYGWGGQLAIHHGSPGPFLDLTGSGPVYEERLVIRYTPATGEADFFQNGTWVGSSNYTGEIGGITIKTDHFPVGNTSVPGLIFDNITVRVLVPEPPTGPTGLTATAQSTASVSLSWQDTSNNETGFQVERRVGTGSFTRIATPGANSTTFSDTGLTPDTTYTYRVRAFNSAGESAWSNEATATTHPLPTTVPTDPSGLTATVNGMLASLSWQDASGEDSYEIERSVNDGAFALHSTVAANTTTYVDGGLAASTTYSYRVRAANAVGHSGYSNTASVTTPAVDSNTSYYDDFTGDLRYAPSPGFSLEIENNTLRVSCTRFQTWGGQYFAFGSSKDFSSAPYLVVRLRSEKPMLVTAYLFHANGQQNWTAALRVIPSDQFVDYFFDFSSIPANLRSGIVATQLTPNGNADSFSGTFWVDSIRAGTVAAPLAIFEAIPSQIAPMDGTGQRIRVGGLRHAASLQVSGAENLVRNVAVSAMTNYSIPGGLGSFSQATITYDCVPGASGTAPLTVTAVGASGYATNSQTFDLTVEPNAPPTLAPIPDVRARAGVPTTVRLGGISDGVVASEQELSISVSSANSSILNIDSVQPITHQIHSPYADLRFTPNSAGQTAVTVTVTDPFGLSVSRQFTLTAFSQWNNAPTLNPIPRLEVFASRGPVSIPLSGISDGDNGSQTLSFEVEVADPSIIAEAVVEYAGGSTATLILTPNPESEGDTVVTVTLSDNGGTANNNGHQSLLRSFEVSSRAVLPTSISWTPAGPNPLADWKAEANIATSVTQEGGQSFVTASYAVKETWDGLWFENPPVDMSASPYLSFDFRASHSGQLTVFLWDNRYFEWRAGTGDPYYNTAHGITLSVQANEWQTITFDFSGPSGFQMAHAPGEVNPSWIVATLINYHSPQLGWPFTNHNNGSFSIRNLRYGDAARPDFSPQASLDPISDQWLFQDPGERILQLSRISSGSAQAPTVSVSASNPAFFSQLSVSTVAEDGSATLIFAPGPSIGQSEVTVTVSADGSLSGEQRFLVRTLAAEVGSAAQVQIDQGTRNQTIFGFGGFQNLDLDPYVEELGVSVMRLGMGMDAVAPGPDNSDPNVLNLHAFNRDWADWNRLRGLHARGVEHFFLTSWSPPSWMKDNLSEVYGFSSAISNTNQTENRLSFHLYEEFAEAILATALIFRQEMGFDLLAIGMQNEPRFCQPYGSAILDPTRFVQLIKIAGRRLREAGLSTRLLMPEDLFGHTAESNAYINALNADAEAREFCDIIALHHFGSAAAWTAYRNLSQQGSAKDLWMTETTIEGSAATWSGALDYAVALITALEHGNVSLWTHWAFGDGQFRTPAGPTMRFHTASQLYRYVRPGAVRLRTVVPAGQQLHGSTFLNDSAHGGRLAMVLINEGNQHRVIRLSGLGGDLPAGFEVSRTDQKTRHGSFGTVASGDLIILPPQSVTSLVSTESVGTNTAPVITQNLQASPMTVGGTTTTLSLTATDADGDPLTITWNTTAAPTGANPVFSGGNQSTGVNPGQSVSKVVTFTTTGEYRFRAVVSDGVANLSSAEVTVTVVPTPTTLVVFPASASVYANGVLALSASFRDQFNGETSGNAITWQVTNGTLSADSGPSVEFRAPAAVGSSVVSASGAGLSGNIAISVIVADNPPSISTASLPEAIVGATYNRRFLGSGEGQLTWAHFSGTLPPGVQIHPDGLFTGVPTAAGTFVFTVSATDARGAVALREMSLIVNPEEVTPISSLWPIDQLPSGTEAGFLESWMGLLYWFRDADPWAYHWEHAWIYPVPHLPGDGTLLWVYAPSTADHFGWVWMTEDTYPWIYASTLGRWLLYLEGTSTPREFWDPEGDPEMIELDP